MADPFYSFGQRVTGEESASAEKKRQLRKDANKKAIDSQVPVQGRYHSASKGRKFKSKSGKQLQPTVKSVKAGWRYNSTVSNPHVAKARNQEMYKLVAQRAHQMQKVK